MTQLFDAVRRAVQLDSILGCKAAARAIRMYICWVVRPNVVTTEAIDRATRFHDGFLIPALVTVIRPANTPITKSIPPVEPILVIPMLVPADILAAEPALRQQLPTDHPVIVALDEYARQRIVPGCNECRRRVYAQAIVTAVYSTSEAERSKLMAIIENG